MVSPVVTFFMPPIATISPARCRFDVFTLVGVHQHQAADAFLGIFDRVVDVRTRIDRSRIDADKSELAEMLVGHQLENKA